MSGRTKRPNLPGVQRTAARPRNPMRTRTFADGIQPRHRRLPMGIDRNAAVVVLCTQRNLQWRAAQINALAQIQINRRPIHPRQPLDRPAETSTRGAQISLSLSIQPRKVQLVQPERVARIIEINPPSPQNRLPIDQQINHR